MAGEFSGPVKAPTRKQWMLYNGPTRTMRRLDSQLAEDGCPDSQVDLAKQLLEDKCDNDEDQEQKARLGVYWLIKASEQGHEEATRLLQHCLETGQGISDQNITDVRSCLDMSQGEKVSRHAVRELFASLSQGEDFITSDQLAEEMSRAQEGAAGPSDGIDERQNMENNWKARGHSSNSEKLTEEVLVSAASHYARGQLPLVHRILTLDNASRSQYQQPFICSCFFHPFQAIRSSYSYLVDSIARRPLKFLFPWNLIHFETLILFTLFALFGLEGFIEALPTLIYFASLSVMVVSTCHVLAKRWESNHFKKWSNLLVAWGGNGVNPEDAQWTHCVNNIRPCFVFITSLLLNLTITPFVPPYNIPHSEVVVVASIGALVTLYNFCWINGKLDMLVLLSFGVHVLARYPYETDAVVSQEWRFLDVHVPTFASYVVGTGVEFCLNFRVFFYLLMPVILVKMSARDKWRGFYTRTLPHSVSLAWWQMAVTASNGATWYGLIRSGLAVAGLVLFLPLAGLATVILPIAAVAKFLMEERLIPMSAAVALGCASLLTMLYIGKKRRRPGKLVSLFQIGFGILSGVLLVSPLFTNSPEAEFSKSSPLTWHQYQSHCDLGQHPMKVASEEKCSHLAGLYIHWEGRVIDTSISRIYNPLALVISKLPVKMQSVVTCMYGEQYEDCRGKSECSVPPGLESKCHVSNWNRYEYEISVAMSAGAWRGVDCLAALNGDSIFRNFTLALIPGDRIWFSGVLVGEPSGVLDGSKPRVRLYQAGCLTCMGDTQPPTTINSVTSAYSIGDLFTALKFVLNFIFNPLVIIK